MVAPDRGPFSLHLEFVAESRPNSHQKIEADRLARPGLD